MRRSFGVVFFLTALACSSLRDLLGVHHTSFLCLAEEESKELHSEHRPAGLLRTRSNRLGDLQPLAKRNLAVAREKKIERCFSWCTKNKPSGEKRSNCENRCQNKFDVNVDESGNADESGSDPFIVERRPFSASDAKGYESCNALRTDITNALKSLANSIIFDGRYDRCNPGIFLRSKGPAPAAVESTAKSNAEPEDSFETNNQEAGVDEGDIVKSNSEVVCAAYGDILYQWDAKTGKVLTRTTMTPIPTRREVRIVYPPYTSKPQIKALLLHKNRLVVIVGWYQSYYRYGFIDPRILVGREKLQLRVYDMSETKPSVVDKTGVPEMKLLAQQDLQGRYIASRSISAIGHIVTKSNFNWFQHYSQYLQRCAEDYRGMDTETYRRAAKAKANALIPTVIKQLEEELVFTGNCRNFAKISSLTTGSTTEDKVPGFYHNVDILTTLTKVTSFDIDEDFDDNSITLSSMNAFLPTSSVDVYVSQDVLVVAGRGWRQWFNDWRNWKERTYLYVFELQDDGSPAKGVGGAEVAGYVLNQFSMDFFDGYLRVATTSSAQWSCARTTLPCRWATISDSSSQISILDFNKPSGDSKNFGKRVGFVEGLGKGERIYAVRFFDDKAFVVTFRQVDPLYAVDLKDPTNPEVKGELKITGFSNYLHPVDDNMLIGIGQDANEETGRTTGFLVSLFNVSDLTAPSLVQRYKVDAPYSYSDAQRNHLAFRYLQRSKVLIVPLQIYLYGHRHNYDGFSLYRVDVDGIEPLFNISHVAPSRIISWRTYCWYNARIPARSLVHKGQLTTMKSHTVQIHDLATQKYIASINLDDGLPLKDCYGYWG